MASLPNVTLIAPFPFWTAQIGFAGNTYTANSLGVVTAPSNDVADLIKAGCVFGQSKRAQYTTPGSPAAANATITVSSTSMTAGATQTLTIGAQPDVMRPLAIVAIPQSGSTLTAGLLTMVYAANDGTTQTDALNLAPNGSQVGNLTLSTSKGVEHLTSAILTGVAGGGNATIQIGTSATLAVPLEPGFVSWAITKETKITSTSSSLFIPSDETVSTLTTSNGLVQPTTAPDAAHWLSFGYTYTMPA